MGHTLLSNLVITSVNKSSPNPSLMTHRANDLLQRVNLSVAEFYSQCQVKRELKILPKQLITACVHIRSNPIHSFINLNFYCHPEFFKRSVHTHYVLDELK